MRVPFKTFTGFLDLLKRTFNEWNSHEAPRMGASLAFYTILSLAPLVIIVVSVLGMVLGHTTAQAQFLEQLRQMVGNDGARAAETVLQSARQTSTGIVANLVGLITLLVGASGVFVELRTALNKLWDVKPPETSGVQGMIKDRFLSFGMVLAIGFLLLVSLSISAMLGAAGKFLDGLGIFPAWSLEAINFIVSLAVVAGVFALIFRYVPDVRLPWNAIWNGAIFTAVLFTIGKTAIGMYLGKAGVGSAYGAAGSLVVLVVWVYYSAQIFFFGAEFTHIVAGAHGPVKDQPSAEVIPMEQAARKHASSAPRPESIVATLAATALIGMRLVRALSGGAKKH